MLRFRSSLAQLDYRFAGQKLSYVGSYFKQDIPAQAPQDLADIIFDFDYYQDLVTASKDKAHELRLSSRQATAHQRVGIPSRLHRLPLPWTVRLLRESDPSVLLAELERSATARICAALDGIAGWFGRALFSYYPKNQQDPHNPYDNVDAYGLLNVYAGVRSNDGAWEVALFAKNVTKTQEQLGVDNGPAATNFQPGGRSLAGPHMRNVRYTPPRELGVNVRYAFGSR